MMLLAFTVVSFVFIDRTFFQDEPFFEYGQKDEEKNDVKKVPHVNKKLEKTKFNMHREKIRSIAVETSIKKDTSEKYLQMLEAKRKVASRVASSDFGGDIFPLVILDPLSETFLKTIMQDLLDLGISTVSTNRIHRDLYELNLTSAEDRVMTAQYLKKNYFIDAFFLVSK